MGPVMGEKTGIAWCDSSWSPWIGCTKVSPGCDGCYAEVLDARYQYGKAKHWGPGVPRYRTKNWGEPIRWNKQAGVSGRRWTVFPSLCDPFDNEVPAEWRADFFRVIQDTPHLTWLLLTKRIGNAAGMLAEAFFDGCPDNVWLGASVVNQEEADRDLPKLLGTPAARHFVSYEPALGPIDLRRFLMPLVGNVRWGKAGPTERGLREVAVVARAVAKDIGMHLLDWVIVGGESSQGSHKARPFALQWARATVLQGRHAGVPVFVKQLGSLPLLLGNQDLGPISTMIRGVAYQPEPGALHYPILALKDRGGAEPAEWPEDLRVQEVPA